MGLLIDWANPILATIGACLAICGTHALDTLRQEVFEARRLNQYQLGERLGSGAMGDVYLAEHRLLKRSCAIKLIHSQKERDRRALAQFEREVQAAARLSHPNLIEIYDYGHTDDGTFYYVMEYLDGLNLGEMVQRYGPLPSGRIIYLLRQVCDGLADAHAAGLIHRDLKPANIFVAKVGQRYDVAKVLDFGLVWQLHTRKQVAEVAGTPEYMAPEQVEADPALDHRADLYALGGVCYYLLTGHTPFAAATPIAMMMAQVNSSVVPPSKIVPSIDPDLEQIVLRCLSKSPAERFASAEELREVLLTCQHTGKWNSHEAREWWQSKIDAMKPRPLVN